MAKREIIASLTDAKYGSHSHVVQDCVDDCLSILNININLIYNYIQKQFFLIGAPTLYVHVF